MLSRRCLQRLIHDQLGVVGKNLDREIELILESNRPPSYLADDLNAWTIEVLEGLFDFCFVAPIKAEQRRKDRNKKRSEAGRQPMKVAPVVVFPHRSANL